MQLSPLPWRAAPLLLLFLLAASLPGPAAAGAYDDAIRACRAETASRLSVLPSEVQIAAVTANRKRPERVAVRWQVRQETEGRCDVLNANVLSWTLERQPPGQKSFRISPEDVCIRAVAREVGKRADDIDIRDVVEKDRDRAVVYWETYQGDRGTCTVAGETVEELKFE